MMMHDEKSEKQVCDEAPAVDSLARMRQKAVEDSASGEVDEKVAPSDWDDERGEFGVLETPVSEAQQAADRKLMRDSRNLAANLGNFGLFLILALGVGYFIGGFLDDLFGTKPIFTVFWIACGFAASIKELSANIKAAQKLAETESTDLHEDKASGDVAKHDD